MPGWRLFADGPEPYQDRTDGGRQLGRLLLPYREHQPIVLALPRGGVPVGDEVARALDAPLDVFLVRKLGVPGHRELAMGAIAPGGVRVLDESVVNALGVTPAEIERIVAEESAELERRQRLYRNDRPQPDLQGRTAILVDDGLATGATARAAIRALRQYRPLRVVLAAPVCARESATDLRAEADDVVCALIPHSFLAVGRWYRRFDQITDAEVMDVLRQAERRQTDGGNAAAAP